MSSIRRIRDRILGRPEDVAASKAADRALWDLQAREEAAGIHEETEEYLALNRAANEAADKLPRWRTDLWQDLAVVASRFNGQITAGVVVFALTGTALVLHSHHVPLMDIAATVLSLMGAGAIWARRRMATHLHCAVTDCPVSIKVPVKPVNDLEAESLDHVRRYLADHTQHPKTTN